MRDAKQPFDRLHRLPAQETPWTLPYRGTVGMACLIVAESAIFIIFVVAYIFYIGKSLSGPTPAQVLELPIFGTVCLSVQQHHRSLCGERAAQRTSCAMHGLAGGHGAAGIDLPAHRRRASGIT